MVRYIGFSVVPRRDPSFGHQGNYGRRASGPRRDCFHMLNISSAFGYSVTAACVKLDDGPLITFRCSEAIILILFPLPFCLPTSPTSHMSVCPLPQWHSHTQPFHGRISCRRNGCFHSFNRIPGIGISLSSFILVGLILYTTFLSPHGPLLLGSSEWSMPANHTLSSPMSDEAPSSPSDVLTLEQIRDIVATTRGFFSRDYSLYLGWNNVSIRDNPIRVELIIPG